MPDVVDPGSAIREHRIIGLNCAATPGLASPLVLPSGQILANRICKTAMAEGLSDRSANPRDAMYRLYERWGQSGAGLLITGNVHIDRRYRERATSLALDRGSDLERYRRLAQAGKAGGAAVWLQLNHGGRQCPAADPVGPSAAPPPFRFSGYAESRALERAEIERCVSVFADAAATAVDCGFDGVQVHAAHGYLISSFLSPALNRRSDDYGGSLRNRARILLEILSAIRTKNGGDRTLAVKLNATDFERDGFCEAEAAEVAGWCIEAGAQCIEISGGSYRRLVIAGEAAPAKTTMTDGPYFAGFTQRLAASVKVPVMLTGGVRRVATMVAALDQGISLVGLGRPMTVAPDVPVKLLSNAIGDLGDLPAPPPVWPRILGPASPLRRIRRYNAFASQAWYSEQIVRLANGDGLDLTLDPRRALRLMARRDRDAR